MENLKDYEIERLCQRFNELSEFLTEDEIVDQVLDDFEFGMFMEEEIYEVFEYWKNKKN